MTKRERVPQSGGAHRCGECAHKGWKGPYCKEEACIGNGRARTCRGKICV
jgi:hypothetical protein